MAIFDKSSRRSNRKGRFSSSRRKSSGTSELSTQITELLSKNVSEKLPDIVDRVVDDLVQRIYDAISAEKGLALQQAPLDNVTEATTVGSFGDNILKEVINK